MRQRTDHHWLFISFEPEVLDHIPEGVPSISAPKPFPKADSCGRTRFYALPMDFEWVDSRKVARLLAGIRSVLLGDVARCKIPDGSGGWDLRGGLTWRRTGIRLMCAGPVTWRDEPD